MDNNPQSSKSHLIIFITTALAVVALVVLLIVVSRGEDEPTPPDAQNQTGQETGDGTAQGQDEASDEPTDEEETEDGDETTEQEAAGTDDEDDEEPITQPANRLPDNWNELSSLEKTVLNPFDCPEDENGIVHLSAETGECLEASDDEEEDEDAGRIDVPENAMVVSFSEAFPYGNNLELAVNGLSCHNLTIVSIDTSHQTDQALTLGQVLEDFADDWRLYKTDPEGWAKFHFEINYDASANQVYYTGFLPYLEDNYKYLLNFESWLQANGIDATDLDDQLFNYLDCRILVSLTNTGPARELAHDCPAWEFRTTMELIGNKRDYGQSHRVLLEPRPADCTDDLLEFLPGEVVESGFTPFVVNADDDILEIIVRDRADTFRVVRD